MALVLNILVVENESIKLASKIVNQKIIETEILWFDILRSVAFCENAKILAQ